MLTLLCRAALIIIFAILRAIRYGYATLRRYAIRYLRQFHMRDVATPGAARRAMLAIRLLLLLMP